LRAVPELHTDPLDDPSEQDRVEPDVRIGLAHFVANTSAQVDARERVDPLSVGTRNGLLDCRLEAVREVEHHVRLLDPPDVARTELDVVRFRAGRREVLDVDLRSAELLGDEGERVEGRHDGSAASCAGRRPTAAQEQGREHEHGNDSHQRKR
jgi:hypothetical protein